MIVFIRQRLQGIVFRIFLIVAMLSLALVVTLSQLVKRKSNKQWIVQIDGSIITQQEVQQQLGMTLLQLQQQFGEYAQMLLSQLKVDPQVLALNNVMSNKIVDQVGDKLDIRLDEDALMQEMIKMVPREALDPSGKINQDMLLRIFPMFTSLKAFEEYIEGSVVRDTVMNVVRGAFYVPQFEVKNKFTQDYQNKKYSVLSFSFDSYMAKEKDKKITDKDLEAFYKLESKKSKKYWTPETRSGTVWEFAPAGFGVQINEKTIESYYNKNKRKLYVKTPTQLQVRHILFAIGDGTKEADVRKKAEKVAEELKKDSSDFAKLAKQYSDDKKTVISGGLTSFFSRGDRNKDFERTAFRLKKDNDVSDLIKTDDGFELIQRVARKDQTYKPLEQVEKDIKNMLTTQRFKGSFERTMRRILVAVDNGKSDFAEFASQKVAKVKQIKDKEKEDTRLSGKFFSLKKDRYGFYVDGDKAVVVKLFDIRKPKLKPLDDVKKEVSEDLQRSRAEKQLRSDMKKARKRAAKDSFEAIKKQFDLKLVSIPFVNSNTAMKESVFKKAKLSFEQLSSLPIVGAVKEHMADSDGYLIRLDKMEPLDQELFKAQSKKISLNLHRDRAQLFEGGFIASLTRNAKIEYNKKFNQRYGKRVL